MELIWKIRFFRPISNFFSRIWKLFFQFWSISVFQYNTRPKWSYFTFGVKYDHFRRVLYCIVLKNPKITKIEKIIFRIEKKNLKIDENIGFSKRPRIFRGRFIPLKASRGRVPKFVFQRIECLKFSGFEGKLSGN